MTIFAFSVLLHLKPGITHEVTLFKSVFALAEQGKCPKWPEHLNYDKLKYMKNNSLKPVFQKAVFLGNVWLTSTLILTLILAPWKTILANGYPALGYWHTFFSMLSAQFSKALLFSLPVALIALLISFFKSGSRPPRPKRSGAASIVFFIVLFSIGSMVFLSVNRVKNKPGFNIILIIVDALRPDFTSLVPGGPDNTPKLREMLLPDSVYFPLAFANAPWTLPSVSSLLTSRYPSFLQVENLMSRLDEAQLTLAEVLREEGYVTGAIVSHTLLTEIHGIHQGFSYFNDRNISDDFHNQAAISSPGVTDDAIDFIRKNHENKFFLMLHYFDPHFMYLDHDDSCPYQGPFNSWDFNQMLIAIHEGDYSPHDLDYLRCCYSSEIRFTDRHLGRLLTELKKNGLYDESLIVFTADHGEEFAEKGGFGHSTSLYNEQIRIPFMIKPPGSISSRLYPDQMVSNLDLKPTVLDLLAVKAPEGMQGKSLARENQAARYIFSEVNHENFAYKIDQAAVMSAGWKLIRDNEKQSYELFDLVNDPFELNDRYAASPPILASLKANLLRWENLIAREKRKPAKTRKPMSEAEKRKLKSLGYL